AGLAPEKRLPVARELGETSLMFLVHPTLTLQGMNHMADMIESVVLRATK
ncbi:MAG: aminotransferase, partial [Pseudopedobacter sp.]|nr:aminotransferase [Deinococcales bacterium]